MTDGSGWASAHMKCLVTGAYGFIGGEVAAAPSARRERPSSDVAATFGQALRAALAAIEPDRCDFNTDVTPPSACLRCCIDVGDPRRHREGACAMMLSVSTSRNDRFVEAAPLQGRRMVHTLAMSYDPATA